MEIYNFVDTNEASMPSQNQETLENKSVLENMAYEADVQTQNSFTIRTPLVPISSRVAYQKSIPDMTIDSVVFEEEAEMSNGNQGINYQPNSARHGQSQRSTNHRLHIPSSPQQQTTPPPTNFSPTNQSALSTASHQRVVYNPPSHSISPPSQPPVQIFPPYATSPYQFPFLHRILLPIHQMHYSFHP